MTSVLKNLHMDILPELVKQYSSTSQRVISMKPFDIKSNRYTDVSVKTNTKTTNFKVSDFVFISKYKNIFPKD